MQLNLESYDYYLSLPAGTRLVFSNAELVKMSPTSSYDGIDEYTVVDINKGTIHHISEFIIFYSEDSILTLKCADGSIGSEYAAYIQTGRYDSLEAAKLRSLLEFHFGVAHHIILDFDRLIRFENFKRKIRDAKKTNDC